MPKCIADYPASQTGLYWGQGGEVSCAVHAPYPDSDTWEWDHWCPMTADHAELYRKQIKRTPECETCGAKAAA